MVICINYRAKIRIADEGLNVPNAGGIVAGGDASINADGDRLLCSASEGVERANSLVIVPVRPVGCTCDERRPTKYGREDERFLYHCFHSECVMGSNVES